MVTKKEDTSGQEESAGRVNLDKLELNKETVTNLSNSEQKNIQGGAGFRGEVKAKSDPNTHCCVTDGEECVVGRV